MSITSLGRLPPRGKIQHATRLPWVHRGGAASSYRNFSLGRSPRMSASAASAAVMPAAGGELEAGSIPGEGRVSTPPGVRIPEGNPFRGIHSEDFVSKVHFINKGLNIPILRVLDYHGRLVESQELPFSMEQALKMYDTMLQVIAYDKIFYDIQRQGRISFYMTNIGEEAAQVGSAAAFTLDDVIFPQYRELGVILWRGFTLENMVSQCFGRADEDGKGRQMPVHYCQRSSNLQAISSPLGVQIPQAAGAGYAFRMADEKRVAVTYFGEGAASEGDFAVALNFAATLKSQSVFICRNNGFAISTSVDEQYLGDGIAARGIAYGMDTIRVDGNDLVATFLACQAARKRAIEGEKPVLVELMTYRGGHHSTSDDSSQYRQDEEASRWAEEGLAGSSRFRRFLIAQGAWSAEKDAKRLAELRTNCIKAIKEGEKKMITPIDDLFTDIYDEPDWRIIEQKEELRKHLSRHANKYDMTSIQPSKDFPFPGKQK